MRRFFIKKSPILLLITAVTIYWNDTAYIFNPVAIGLMLLLILLLITDNIVLKVSTSVIFIILSLYMMLAVISEYREFESGDVEGLKLLVIGLSFFIATFILSLLVLRKREKNVSQNIRN